ncbi:uncharacterized protein LOC123988305 [Osmia bicornis bicornis]|uniref:uncharacterized protein LOC123988305 n=1 Tax=Osmia bicornis bicornis TaxID=1437191 RepID=UPI001EAEAF79|nr:uncharacterized protein LOC123988305 [Osmia bicornis bicornis]
MHEGFCGTVVVRKNQKRSRIGATVTSTSISKQQSTAAYNSLQQSTAAHSIQASSHGSRHVFRQCHWLHPFLFPEIESFIERAQAQSSVGNQVTGQIASPVSSQSPAAVKLPTIQLPTFDGNYSGWIRFRDTFSSLVHESELSDVQKFHYLNSALKGPAARVIQSLGVSDSNYHLAWDALKSRYENAAALRKHHVTTLLDMSTIQKQSPTALRELVDDARNHLAALKSLNEPVGSWDSLIVPILCRKLDGASLREWEKGATSSEKITFNKFATFLEERFSYLENIISQRQVAAVKTEPPTGLPGHRVQACTRKHCDLCGKKHHILLHRVLAPRSNATITEESGPSQPNTTIACVAHSEKCMVEQSILSTAVVYVEDRQGQRVPCRTLLDSGSQSNFITYNLCKKLGIKYEPTDVQVSGLAGKSSAIKDRVNVRIASRVNNFSANISCLADPDFNKSRPIDMLIGVGLFWHLLCVGQHNAGSELLWQKTQLGWVLGGKISWPINEKIQRCHLVTNQDLYSLMERFWQVEEVEVGTGEEIDECEAFFRATTRRDKTGRYIVQIPFNSQVERVGTSRQQAENRFKSIERKLSKQPQLREQYVQFMKEYEALGHMTRISTSIVEEPAANFYFPHHAVIREDSTTTKLRVVFDGSAKSSTGVSLNDTQKVGPTVLKLEETKRNLSTILQKTGLQLRKWVTNCPEFEKQSSESQDKKLSADSESKILGLHWSAKKDELYFKVAPSPHNRITKRTILSEIAQIFDPLGLVGPAITGAKLIMQQFWQSKTDASERAYGACVYLRAKKGSDNPADLAEESEQWPQSMEERIAIPEERAKPIVVATVTSDINEGLCQSIVSDNGTNFVGAKNRFSELDELIKSEKHNSQIAKFLSEKQIQWHLIPPQAPHFGGLWESAVRVTKHHLNRVIGEQSLTLLTVLLAVTH